LTRHSWPRADALAPRWAVIGAFAIIYIFWGGTFLALRYAVAEVPPLLTIATRCIGGALVLYAWLGARRRLEPTTVSQWLTSALAGGFLFVGCHGVLAGAEQRVSSGQAALYMSSTPLWMVLLSSWRERRMPHRVVLAGLVLGVAGVALLTGGDGVGTGSTSDRLALLGGGLSWALGSLIGRDGSKPQSVTQSTAMQLLGGGLMVLLLSAVSGELSGWDPHQLTSRAILSVGFLVFGGTVLGFGAYTWLLQATSTAAAGTYAFVNPVVALALAWLVGDEPFALRTVLAGVVVVVGVLLIWRSSAMEGRRREAARHPERGGESALRRVLRALEMTRYADTAARIRPRANPD
jgi:drug/metabolite transporter (DMT)-like permease